MIREESDEDPDESPIELLRPKILEKFAKIKLKSFSDDNNILESKRYMIAGIELKYGQICYEITNMLKADEISIEYTKCGCS